MLDKIPPHRGYAAEYACQWFWGFCERAMQEPSRSHAPPLKGGLRTSKVAPTCEGWEPNKGGDDLPASACGLYSNDRSAESDHANRVHPGHTPPAHMIKYLPAQTHTHEKKDRKRVSFYPPCPPLLQRLVPEHADSYRFQGWVILLEPRLAAGLQ